MCHLGCFGMGFSLSDMLFMSFSTEKRNAYKTKIHLLCYTPLTGKLILSHNIMQYFY